MLSRLVLDVTFKVDWGQGQKQGVCCSNPG